MRRLAQFALFTLSTILASTASAGWQSDIRVTDLTAFADGFIHVAIRGANTSDTCSYWGYHFRFDGKTDGGRLMYDTLLEAQSNARVIALGYTASTLPGTDNNSGCAPATMATLNYVTARYLLF